MSFSLLLTLLLTAAAHAKAEKEIFVACTPSALEGAFDDKFEKEQGKNVHPVSGEELSMRGHKKIGEWLIEDRNGIGAHFRERPESLEIWAGSAGKHKVYCQEGRAVVVVLTWPGDLVGFHQAMTEKYGWNVSRNKFAADVDKYLAKGLVYVVQDTKDRVVTSRINQVDGKTRVRIFYYSAPALDAEIAYLNHYDEEKKKEAEAKFKKAKDSLL